jgi:hypothetical protein
VFVVRVEGIDSDGGARGLLLIVNFFTRKEKAKESGAINRCK